MKKICLVLVALMVLLSLSACGDSQTVSLKKSGNNKQSSEIEEVTAPITVELWHTFASGEQAEYMQNAIDKFNSTNDKGITVVGNYIGGYVELRTSLSTAISTGQNPQMAVLGMSPILASNDVLTDMTPYATRDNFDVSNFYDSMKGTMYYDDKLVSLPFIRSTTLFVYNEDMWKGAGFDMAPTNVEELKTQAAAVAKKYNNKGFGMGIDPSFYQESLIQSLGGQGIVDKDGKSASCLTDGTMLQMLTDWKSWIDSGWCYKPSLTNTSDDMKKLLYSNKLASGLFSSGELSTIYKNAKQAGININATVMPGYNGVHGVSGGGDISIIDRNTSSQEKAACWEFIKFLFTDEQVVERHKSTGYLPMTKSATECDSMKAFWNENPIYRVAFDSKDSFSDPTASAYRSEWNTQVSQAISYVIQDGSKTPKESVDYLSKMYDTVFID